MSKDVAEFDPTDPESATPGGATWEEVPGLIARGLVTRDAAGEAELCQLARFGAGGR